MGASTILKSTYMNSCKNRLINFSHILPLFFFLILFKIPLKANNTEPSKKSLIIFYQDYDGDGYGNPLITIESELQPEGYVTNDDDCNDNNANINPGANEVCDALNEDEDCDGVSDNNDYFPIGQQVFYRDNDDDGYGNPNEFTNACDLPSGFVTNDDDCNDTNADISPADPEVCDALNEDEDCDGVSDNNDNMPLGQQVFYLDQDNDGYGNPMLFTNACDIISGFVTNDDDCNDNNANISPADPEVCDALNEDEDCDGVSDNNDNMPEGQQVFYRDEDNDEFGDFNQATNACDVPPGFASEFGDCNDLNTNVNPSQIEICNNIDDDCDTGIDEDLANFYYQDLDGDGFGTSAFVLEQCAMPDTGFATNKDDCDDSNPAINPDGIETCNEVDDDCDEFTDEDVQNIYYIDNDGDSWGSDATITLACSLPVGYASNKDDCDDFNTNIHPGIEEICNDVDDNCDQNIDEGIVITYFQDADEDFWGNPTITIDAGCNAPAGYVSNNGDCDDTNILISPAGTEICNGVDDNCDLDVDEFLLSTFYIDSDNDGYGSTTSVLACNISAGLSNNDYDCNDNNAAVKPNATEVCNNIDDDCDNLIDEGVILSFYVDNDLDGYGSNTIILACSGGPGKVTNQNDCNDNNAAVKPNATEVCNNIDDDCDNQIDEGVKLSFYVDNDLDGYGSNTIIMACTGGPGKVTNRNDCNDNNAAVKPGATEICNGIDDDCDNKIDEYLTTKYYEDADADNLGDPGSYVHACTQPSGYVTNKNDNCPDDYNPNQYDIDDDGDGDVCDDELDLCEAIDILIEEIEDAGLSNSLENSLINKLEQALDKFEDNKYSQSISKLNSFINQVNSKKGNGIPTSIANYWIYVANLMIDHIEDGTADCDGGGGCREFAPDGTENKIQAVNVMVYPNPTNDFINIINDEIIKRITVSQVNGAKAIYELDLRDDESTNAIIDLSELGLTTGLYLISVHSETKINNFNLTFNR